MNPTGNTSIGRSYKKQIGAISKMSFFDMLLLYMMQSIQEWTRQNLWKTAFKKFEGVWNPTNASVTFILKVI